MAHFIRDTGNALTPMQHSDDIFKESLRQNPYNDVMGAKDSGKPIIVDSSAFKGRMSGDTVRFHFIPQNKTDGIHGQNPSILGNEDSLDEFYMDMKIDQEAKAFAKKGKMTDKRMIWDFRDQSKMQLTNWFRDRYAYWITESLTGYMSDGQVMVSAPATADVVSGAGRLLVAKGASSFLPIEAQYSDETSLLNNYDGANAKLATADVMNTTLLDVIEEYAKDGNSDYRMLPIKSVNGGDYYILYLSLQCCRQLRVDTRFEKRMISLIASGLNPEKDVFATGAMGVWNNIIIKKNEFIHKFGGTDGKSYARNLLVGGNALVQGFAQTIDYTEELTDHNRKLSCASDVICGHKKVTFNGVDLNVMQVVSYSK